MTRSIKQLLGIVLIALASMSASASEVTDSVPSWWKFVPNFHGTFRAFYEYSTDIHQSRFYVADARLTMGGYILPWADYFMQVNFDSQGKIMILDAFGRIHPTKDKRLDLYIGQMRVPINYAACENPWEYHFSEVMLTEKLAGLRSVGVKAGYTFPKSTFYVEGGMFNATGIGDHTVWNRAFTYAIKANWRKAGFWPELAFLSRTPGGYGAGARTNTVDASLEWQHGSWFAEAEYLYSHYTHSTHKAAQAYGVMASYTFHPNWRMANRWSVEGRFDGITDASDGMFDANHKLATTIFAHRRVSVGTTLGYRSAKGLLVDFRVNYFHCFYSDPEAPAAATDKSKIVAGAIFHF